MLPVNRRLLIKTLIECEIGMFLPNPLNHSPIAPCLNPLNRQSHLRFPILLQPSQDLVLPQILKGLHIGRDHPGPFPPLLPELIRPILPLKQPPVLPGDILNALIEELIKVEGVLGEELHGAA